MGWIVGGNAILTRLRDMVGIEFPIEEGSVVSTLSQWGTERLGRPTRGGDQLAVDSVNLLVGKVRRQAVQEAQPIRDVHLEADDEDRAS